MADLGFIRRGLRFICLLAVSYLAAPALPLVAGAAGGAGGGNVALPAAPAFGRYQIVSCTVDPAKKDNPTYYHFAGVNTVLRCEMAGTDGQVLVGTLSQFYAEGWRLIEVMSVDSRLVTKDNTVPFSWLYLEKRVE